MKKTLLTLGCAAVLGMASYATQAALTNGMVLNIDPGQAFEAEVSPGFFLPVPIYQIVDGIHLGTTQLATGSHSGDINGSESPSIDLWEYGGNTGMDYTRSPTNVLSASGNQAEVDFSGWSWGWNGIELIDLGTGAFGGNADGVADITCAVDCGDGDTYSLYYTATVPESDPNGFGGMRYHLNLAGTVSAVPVPAAVWLFGSGLMGLIGCGYRKATCLLSFDARQA